MAQQLRCGFNAVVVAEWCKNDAYSHGGGDASLPPRRNAPIPKQIPTPLTLRNPSSQLSCLASKGAPSYLRYEIRKRDPNLDAAALLVVDMQNHFASIAEPIMGNVLTTIDLCRHVSMPVFFTRHNHKSEEDYGMLGEWSLDGMIMDGSEDAELVPGIRSRVLGPGEVVEKKTYSAFADTGLEEKLKEMGVEEVIVTGVMTNLCCETTAREAFIRDFRVFFSTDATATLNYELHEATLMNLAFGFAYLLDCQTLRTALHLHS